MNTTKNPNSSDGASRDLVEFGTVAVKRGMADMIKGGVKFD